MMDEKQLMKELEEARKTVERITALLERKKTDSVNDSKLLGVDKGKETSNTVPPSSTDANSDASTGKVEKPKELSSDQVKGKNDEKEEKVSETKDESRLKDSVVGSSVLAREKSEMLKLESENALKGVTVERNFIKEQEELYTQLKALADTKVTASSKSEKLKFTTASFNQNFKLKFTKDIPRFFSIFVDRMSPATALVSSDSPAYVGASVSAFAFGVRQVRVVFKSEGVSPPIDFDPFASSEFGKIIAAKTLGPESKVETSYTYLLKVVQTIFSMVVGCQVVVLRPENVVVQPGAILDSGDFVQSYSMLLNTFINQSFPLLPAGGFHHQCSYFRDHLRDMFQAPNHRMKIGRIATATYGALRLFEEYACVSDAYFASMNRVFINYLKNSTYTKEGLLSQFNSLSYQHTSYHLENPAFFEYSVPIRYSRDECDGAILMYMLSSDRRLQFVGHLRDLLAETNALHCRTPEQLSNLEIIKQMSDRIIKNRLNLSFTSCTVDDVYFTLAAELSTLWIDVKIVNLEPPNMSDPLRCLMDIFAVLLWINWFPAIAVDCMPFLMYRLFSGLDVLAPTQTRDFIDAHGYARQGGRAITVISLVSEEQYRQGAITFPILNLQPARPARLFRALIRCLRMNDRSAQNTRDTPEFDAIRMRTHRTFTLPWSLMGLPVRTIGDDSPFARRINEIITVMLELISTYQTMYRSATSRSQFGDTNSKTVVLIAFFQAISQEFKIELGNVTHCILNKLRVLGENSIYVLDDNFVCDFQVRNLRPRLAAELGVNRWDSYIASPAECPVKFELVLFMFYSLIPPLDIKLVRVPDAARQFENMRAIAYEGQLFGDVLAYVNRIKYGLMGDVNNTIMSLTNMISVVSCQAMVRELLKLFNLKDYTALFQIILDNDSRLLDSRGRHFRVILGLYHTIEYTEPTVELQPYIHNSKYWENLHLYRPLIHELVSIASRVFVPQTSPIFLYVRGLFVHKRYESELDPSTHIDVPTYAQQYNHRLVMWSPDIIRTRTADTFVGSIETIFQFTDLNGDQVIYVPGTQYPHLVFVITALTGSVPRNYHDMLLREFRDSRISFLLPDLSLGIRRHTADLATQDYELESQFSDILSGYATRKLVVDMNDTRHKPYTFAESTHKEKWFYPIFPVVEPDVVLTGMIDPTRMSRDFRVSSPFMWAHGINGTSVEMNPDEAADFGIDPQEINLGGDVMAVNKLDLRVINFNNDLLISTSEKGYDMPKVAQYSEGVVEKEFLRLE